MNNSTLRAISISVRIMLGMTWSATAAAAVVAASSMQEQLVSLDPLLLLLAVVISTLAGGTSLALRVNSLLMDRPDGEPMVRPWLFAVAHMGGSWMAGAAGFFWGKESNWGVWMILLCILLLSFMGSKAIEMLAEKFMGSVKLGDSGKGK